MNQARILEQPTRPHRLLNIAAGLLVGLIGAIVLAFVREGIEDRIHTAEDIRYWTGQSSISVVPVIEPANQQKLLFTPGRKLLPIVAGENAAQNSDLFLLARPTAPESEAVHALRTTLLLCHKKCAMKVIVVTSPLPGEGKTTLANNLAIAFSSAGRTCLVDADLRRPSAGSSFRLDPCKGLEHYLRGVATLEEVTMEPDGMSNLVIIPSILPTDTPIQLLNDKTMRDLISRLRGMFDFVVLDTPPILPYADSRALAAIADGVVLVSRAGQTSRGAIKRSMELLFEVQSAPILTTVLNGAQNLSPDYGYYYNRYN